MKNKSKVAGFSLERGSDSLTPTYLPKQEAGQPPCQSGCPNCGDIRTWIGLVAQRDKIGISEQEAYTQAWRTITDVKPTPTALPASAGSVGRPAPSCPHALRPKQCTASKEST